MTAKSFTCRWSLLALTAVLSFISTVFSSAQPVGIAPDKETLSAPFSPKDEAAFKAPEKVSSEETSQRKALTPTFRQSLTPEFPESNGSTGISEAHGQRQVTNSRP